MTARRLRGLNFTGTLRALGHRHGEEIVARVRAHVPGEAGAALREGAISLTGWYPVDWYDALLATIERELPREPSVCRDLARHAVAEDLATIFRALSFVASPDFALVNATRAASMYFDGGTISVIDARPGVLHFRFVGYDGFTPRIWQDFVGGMEAVIDLLRLTRLPTEILAHEDLSRCDVVLRYAT